MNLNKHLEYFDPSKNSLPIHVVGVGAIGSTVCELLTRLGFELIIIHDFDVVNPHNIANQMFRHKDINKPKVEAVAEMCKEINPDIEVYCNANGWEAGQVMSGIIILAVDNIEIRKAIVQQHMLSSQVKLIMDFRMRLEDAQHYAANWENESHKQKLIDSMNFTEAEAKEATPVNACGSTLAIAPTIRTIVSMGVANLINFLKDNEKLATTILVNPFTYFATNV